MFTNNQCKRLYQQDLCIDIGRLHIFKSNTHIKLIIEYLLFHLLL